MKPGMSGWKQKEALADKTDSNIFQNIMKYCIKQVEINVFHNYNMRPMIKFCKKHFKDQTDLITAEIGVGHGHNSYNILANLPVKKHYCIDPYLYYKDHALGNQDIQDNNYLEAEKYLKGKFGDKVEFICKKSEDACVLFPDNFFDILYIDGNHWLKYIKKDIDLYYPKIKHGGIIGGHDFCATYSKDIGNAEVCRAVIDFVDKHDLNDLLNGRHTDWWLIKKINPLEKNE